MNGTNGTADVVDLDSINSTATKQIASEVELEPYDPRPGEDSARRRIAYSLLIMLAFIVLAAFISYWIHGNQEVDAMIKFTQALLGPVVPLVSAATGFYYGTKTQDSN